MGEQRQNSEDENAKASLLKRKLENQISHHGTDLTNSGIHKDTNERKLLILKIFDRFKFWGCTFKHHRTVLVGLVVTSVLVNVALVTFIIWIFIPKDFVPDDVCTHWSSIDSRNVGRICFISEGDCQTIENTNVGEIGNLCCNKTAMSTIYLVQLMLAESSYEMRRKPIRKREALFMYYPDKIIGKEFQWSSTEVITKHSVFRTFRNQIEIGLAGLYSIYMSVTLKYDSSRCKEKFSMGLTVKQNGKAPRTLFRRHILPAQKQYAFQTEVFYDTFWLQKEDCLNLMFSDANCIQLYKPLNYMLIYKLK